MVSTVDPEGRRAGRSRSSGTPADGLAYALAIAEKHRLTYPSVKARVAR